MAGIYIHIPYCKQKCNYCNFHFSTQLHSSKQMISAICKELVLRKAEVLQPISTIYFGGGTPSIISEVELSEIFNALHQNYNLSQLSEVTLECNPDDISTEKLKLWKSLGINRLSIGVQSFYEEDLQLMNRAHNATEAIHCITQAQDFGFSNLTLDLIYGSPSTTTKMWESNLEKVAELQLPHFSAYALTVEPKTKLANDINKGIICDLDDEKQLKHFTLLQDFAQKEGYIQYEISNFGKENHFAIHNTSYWNFVPYLGIGPSAHSFNGKNVRRFNIANNTKYILNLQSEKEYYETENLTEKEQFNERIMIGLRSIFGISIKDLEARFSASLVNQFTQNIQPYLTQEISLKNHCYVLNNSALFKADGIASDLFLE